MTMMAVVYVGAFYAIESVSIQMW